MEDNNQIENPEKNINNDQSVYDADTAGSQQYGDASYQGQPNGGWYQADNGQPYGQQYQADNGQPYGQQYQADGRQPYGQYQQYGTNPPPYHPYQTAGGNQYGNGFGIASVILGILSLMLFCTCVNIPMAIAAVIFGILQLSRGTEGRGMAIAGIVTAVLSVIALVAAVALMWRPFMAYYREELSDIQQPGYHYEYDYDYGDDYDEYYDRNDSYDYNDDIFDQFPFDFNGYQIPDSSEEQRQPDTALHENNMKDDKGDTVCTTVK